MPAVLRVFICELFIEGQTLLLLSSGIPKSFVKYLFPDGNLHLYFTFFRNKFSMNSYE